MRGFSVASINRPLIGRRRLKKNLINYLDIGDEMPHVKYNIQYLGFFATSPYGRMSVSNWGNLQKIIKFLQI